MYLFRRNCSIVEKWGEIWNSGEVMWMSPEYKTKCYGGAIWRLDKMKHQHRGKAEFVLVDINS